ncbi:hypothetical protein LCGC14_2349900, partial [marine sediment metagenome]
TENIKLHSELKGDSIDLIIQFFNFAVEKIDTFNPKILLPDNKRIKKIVNDLKLKILEKRLNTPQTQNNKKNLLDGERYEISAQIAKKIGRLLDKALYSKFKNKRKPLR